MALIKKVDTPNSQFLSSYRKCTTMGKRFDKEFKFKTLLLASEPGNTQAGIECDHSISQRIISRWKREFSKYGEQAFPEKAARKTMTSNFGASNVRISAFAGSVIPYKSSGHLFGESIQTVGLINEHRTYWSVDDMCRSLSVSLSGCYRWRSRHESRRAITNRRLDANIQAIYAKSKRCYGEPKGHG